MIKVKTSYNKEAVTAFYRFQFYHDRQRKNIRIIAVFCIAYGIINFFISNDTVSGLVFWLGVGLLLNTSTTFFLDRQIKEIIKSDVGLKMGLETEFSFYDNYFEVKGKRSQAKLFYSELYCYCENEEYFYLYINSVFAYMVKKDEHSSDVSTLLQVNVQKK